MEKADIPSRLRQSILLNDITLVKRLLTNHPEHLHNPDFSNKSNTSLHLAAQYGFVEIAEYLISLGHDSSPQVTDYIYSRRSNNLGISVNTDGQCPLHVAAANSRTPVVELLCTQFPQTVNRADFQGCTPLHLAASAHSAQTTNATYSAAPKPTTKPVEDVTTIEVLLTNEADVNAQDKLGNTCLHNASAWGNLKAIRALIQAGADPLCSNYAGWTPEYYSITVQAEVYYRNLVTEWQKLKAGESAQANERRAKGGGAVRLVGPSDESDDAQSDQNRSRAGSGKSQTTVDSDNTSVLSVARIDAWR